MCPSSGADDCVML